MDDKKNASLGRAGGTTKAKFSENSNLIIPQTPQKTKLINTALRQAEAAGDWRRWWRIYCEANGLPERPTGRDVKLAAIKKGMVGNG